MCLQGREDEYTYQFTHDDITELTAAVSKVKASGVTTERQILQVRYNSPVTFLMAHCMLHSNSDVGRNQHSRSPLPKCMLHCDSAGKETQSGAVPFTIGANLQISSSMHYRILAGTVFFVCSLHRCQAVYRVRLLVLQVTRDNLPSSAMKLQA